MQSEMGRADKLSWTGKRIGAKSIQEALQQTPEESDATNSYAELH